MTKEITKEKQISFLKEHEEEMVEYIKKYSSKKEKIVFRWDTAEIDGGVAFSKPVLVVKFDINNSQESKYNDEGYILRIDTDIKKLDKIDGLTVLTDPIYSNIERFLND